MCVIYRWLQTKESTLYSSAQTEKREEAHIQIHTETFVEPQAYTVQHRHTHRVRPTPAEQGGYRSDHGFISYREIIRAYNIAVQIHNPLLPTMRSTTRRGGERDGEGGGHERNRERDRKRERKGERGERENERGRENKKKRTRNRKIEQEKERESVFHA